MNHERLYLQAASRAVFCDNADVGWIDAGADKTGQMLILHISHLENKHILLFFLFTVYPYKYFKAKHYHYTEYKLVYKQLFSLRNC